MTVESRSIYSGPIRRSLQHLQRQIEEGGGGGGGGTGTDEVWIGPNAPTDEAMELWFDTDAIPPAITNTQIVAVPYDEWPPTSPLPDVLYLRIAP